MIEWLNNATFVQRLLVAIFAPLMLAFLRFCWKLLFGTIPIQWVKVADQKFSLATDGFGSQQTGFLQTYHVKNKSFRNLEGVELWFDEKPVSIIFEPSTRYSEENSNRKHVVTINTLPARGALTAKVQVENYDSLSKVIWSGNEARKLFEFKPVSTDALVLPSYSEILFWLMLLMIWLTTIVQVMSLLNDIPAEITQ